MMSEMNFGYSEQSVVSDSGWQLVRAIRDGLLKDTDWLVLKYQEQATELPVELKAYRQALRDIPQQFDTIGNVTWPTKPTL